MPAAATTPEISRHRSAVANIGLAPTTPNRAKSRRSAPWACFIAQIVNRQILIRIPAFRVLRQIQGFRDAHCLRIVKMPVPAPDIPRRPWLIVNGANTRQIQHFTGRSVPKLFRLTLPNLRRLCLPDFTASNFRDGFIYLATRVTWPPLHDFMRHINAPLTPTSYHRATNLRTIHGHRYR